MTRAVTVVVALVVLGWLGLMYRDARLLHRGVEQAGQLRSQADFERADAALADAGLLNPDTTPDLARALLHYGRGRTRPAIAATQALLRREPSNLEAWALLYTMTRERDPAAAQRALAARRRLDPLNARVGARPARSARP